MNRWCNDGAWIAIQVQGKAEQRVVAGLLERRYDVFLPMQRRSARPRVAGESRPLFPGYAFCRYIHNHPFRIVEIPGVVRLVGDGRSPMPIPDAEIAAIRCITESGLRVEPWRSLMPGQLVHVHRGALRGLQGIFLEMRNATRLIVSVPSLARAVAVEVCVHDVCPLAAVS